MTISESPRLDSARFRTLLRRQAATVTVVTAAGEPPAGFTATSFTSVSLRPPLVSFCLDRGSSSWPTVASAGHVAVHLLGAGQHEIARIFATSGIDRFAAYPQWRLGPYGVPLLDGTIAWLVCRTVDRVVAGDHAIVLAEPLVGHHHAEDVTPLLYHMGRYASLTSALPTAS
ncbi:flavin reductase family protein [Micromonospora sp. HM5-17]|jgi:flavin reductase (DIM6/NTAB) family NADH-FMN oxidoreductase RutF|uniref:flavin reductase family protein n=1 Tax=Micromonospora sp. HM5-17 TaxID=2487710 RepID=UPI000F4788BC|nr:flavin reductase family protein [Micromonospora sp. HM5-17]ROT27242.1 flavin reductase [Micromonospora sp. HM5-17]